MIDDSFDPAPSEPTVYTAWTNAELENMPPPAWIVKRFLPAQGLAFVYGASQSGKTFLVMDLALSLANGLKEWFGLKAKPASVVYLPLEGIHGIAGRINAWYKDHGITRSENFYAIKEGRFSIKELPTDVEGIARFASKRGAKVVIIDTLARAAVGLKENENTDMATVLAAAHQIGEITGGVVIIIHHTGKDGAKEMRGASCLPAGADTLIRVNETAGGRSWETTKQKDGPRLGEQGFKLYPVVIGNDDEGDEVSSCAVHPETLQPTETDPLKGLGKNQIPALQAIRGALTVDDNRLATLGAAGVPDGVRSIKHRDAVNIAAAALAEGGTPAIKSKDRAREAIDGLVYSGKLQKTGGTLQPEKARIWLKP